MCGGQVFVSPRTPTGPGHSQQSPSGTPTDIIGAGRSQRTPAMIQTLFGSAEQKPSFLDRMKEAVTRTRENLAERIDDVVGLGKEIDRATLDDLEGTLLGADLGTTTTHEVLEKLRDKADRKQIKNVDELKRLLKEELLAILTATVSGTG